jgi:predicted dehydrogenase
MERRDFMIKGGLASTAILASTASKASPLFWETERPVRLGIVGTGSRGGGLIPIINRIPGLEVTACCDVLPFRLEAALKRAPKSKGYDDHRALLDDKKVDAVLVATPFGNHEEIVLNAVDEGKHVYCEKTMVKGLEGIDRVVKKVKDSKLVFQTGHQYQNSRLYGHVVDLIRQGEIGQIASFECQYNRNGDWRRPVPDPSLERAINWRMYRELSGGLTAELSSHQIDFIHWVLGEVPTKIMGVGGIDYWKDGRETYDNTHLIFDYPSGVRAKFTCLTSNAQGDYQVKVLGSKGSILLSYAKAWIYYEKGHEKVKGEVDGVSGATLDPLSLEWGIPLDVSHTDPSEQALIDFRDCIVEGTQPTSNVITGANSAVAVQLALDAMQSGSVIQWDPAYTY